nr:hypothetical protein [Neorhizobium galegae]
MQRNFARSLHLIEAKDRPKMFGHAGERKSQRQHGLLRSDVRRPDDANQPAQRQASKAELDHGFKTFSDDSLAGGKPKEMILPKAVISGLIELSPKAPVYPSLKLNTSSEIRRAERANVHRLR